MNITNDEFNFLISKIRSICEELLNSDIDEVNLKGILGEKIVGFSISLVMWKLGYSLDLTNRPRSYYIIPHFQANRDGIRGIDYLIKITDSNENTYDFYIEVKNWANYDHITPDVFNSQILQRFIDADNDHHGHWMVTMNTRNIELINERCNQSNIHILPFSHHITSQQMNQTNIIHDVYQIFIDAFEDFIKRIAPERNYPNMNEMIDNMSRTEGVIQDILMGVSYNVIQERYGVSRNYIIRIGTYIRGFIPTLPDRRNPRWREQWEIQG